MEYDDDDGLMFHCFFSHASHHEEQRDIESNAIAAAGAVVQSIITEELRIAKLSFLS